MGVPNYKEAHEYDHELKVCTLEEAAQVLIGKKKICFLTGAGISASSGIPTFRGEDGFWKKRKQYADEEDPMKICTLEFFDKHAKANWEWHYDF